jgi:cell division septal protein FtsQ
MENEKSNWVNSIMRSVTDVRANEVRKEVYDWILFEIDKPEINKKISFKLFERISIAALLILVMNIGVLSSSIIMKQKQIENTSISGLESYNLDIY